MYQTSRKGRCRHLAQAEAEVEADVGKIAHGEKAVDAGVEKQDFAEDGEAGRPCGFEPAEIDGKAEDGEDEEVAPVAAVIDVSAAGLPEEDGNGAGQQGVERKPGPVEIAGGAGDDDVRDAQRCGRCKLCPERQTADEGVCGRREESRGQVRDEREQGGDDVGCGDEVSDHEGQVYCAPAGRGYSLSAISFQPEGFNWTPGMTSG